MGIYRSLLSKAFSLPIDTSVNKCPRKSDIITILNIVRRLRWFRSLQSKRDKFEDASIAIFGSEGLSVETRYLTESSFFPKILLRISYMRFNNL